MSDFVSIELLPLGQTLRVERGTPLQDLLFSHGVEFPCGGRGRCKGCKIKVLAGSLPPTTEDHARLSLAEIAGAPRPISASSWRNGKPPS
jgi:ferredoxin